MAVEETPETVGVRLARARKRRGLTQGGLAQRCNYSRSHIAQVEAGHKVATPAFVTAAARALGVDPPELYGQPFRGENARDDRVHAAISEIRRAIAYADVGPDYDEPPRSLDQLAAELATVHRLRRDARHRQLGARLPALIEELIWHANRGDDERAWGMLHHAEALAASLARRLGYNDLSGQLLERAALSAERSQDPHLVLALAPRRALLLMNVAAYEPAARLLERSIGRVDSCRDDATEILGTLHLRAAIVCARARRASTAWDHYHQATEVSRRAGMPSLDRHATDFDPGNIAVHGAAVAVELGDLDEAVRRDRGMGERTLAGLAAERRAHHEIDMARVHVETGGHDRALERLLSAERIAPQMTRFHPGARAVVAHLVDVRRALPEPLRALHTRMSA